MMSIASPKLPPVVLTTNTNGQNQTNSSPITLKKEVNNNMTHVSNGNGSKSNHTNKANSVSDSPSKRKSRVIESSDESDDDKPLVTSARFLISTRFFYFSFLSIGEESRCYQWSKLDNACYYKDRINANSEKRIINTGHKKRTQISNNTHYRKKRAKVEYNSDDY